MNTSKSPFLSDGTAAAGIQKRGGEGEGNGKHTLSQGENATINPAIEMYLYSYFLRTQLE